ncbi:hypothetical protein [Aliiglaciecola sp. LCG003]|uniref:hypothetical protein n=1 Tax=Aliiglaciecola sp. LCG003 TaxID=3053655 RepID=UPI002572D148|nr:hypothetical protein [Aliiglaciecola sp. LCG003]WJG08904.1 hypothetical protein QR722_16435 [Aliiglaciecola sp. LCG003]
MTTITLSNQTNTTLFTQWVSSGWKLFLHAPIKLFFGLLAMMIVAGLFQVLPAPYGLLISKWVGACFAALLWPILDQLATSGRFSFKGLSAYSGWKYVPTIALVLMLPFVFQVGVATAMLGNDGFNLIIFGEIAAITPLQVASIFASSAPLLVLLMFVPALLMLNQESPTNALIKGLKMVLNAWQPMLLFVIINAVILFLAPYTFALSAVFLTPLLICINYCAYQSLRNH